MPQEPKVPLRDNAISEVRVEIKKKTEPPTMDKKKSLRPEENMTAWEYYNFLMSFGKRKMTRIEWVIWKMKKDEEDTQRGYVEKKDYLRGKMSSAEYHWRIKKDPDFVDTVARGEFALDFKKSEAW